MKLFLLVCIFLLFAAGCGKFNTKAQIRASNTGSVKTGNSNKTPVLDISSVDFKNFTFPEFDGSPEKTFTLKNGASENKNTSQKYTLRKTYYFDLTGDERDEAISHIIADGCRMGCESSSLFYIHTADGNQPKLLWKIATGGDALSGLRVVNFKLKTIILEAFGECWNDNGVIKPNVDLKKNAQLKTTSYTRFEFALGENGFMQRAKTILPLPAKTDIVRYRPQISFGEPE